MSDAGRYLFDEAYQARKRLRLAALAGSAVALLLWLSGLGKGFDLRLLDQWTSISGNRRPSPQVVIVSLDEASIAKYGTYPWARSTYVPLIDKLASAGAKVIGLDIIFDRNPREDEPAPATAPGQPAEGPPLSHNQLLARAMERAGNIVYGFVFDNFPDPSPPGGAPPEGIERQAIPGVRVDDLRLLRAPAVSPTEEVLARAARALGHYNILPDEEDGNIRAVPLVIRHGDKVYPSVSLQMARLFQGLPPDEVKLELDRVRVGYADIPITQTGLTLLNWTGDRFEFPVYSLLDVVEGKVQAEALRGKAVLVGMFAKGYDERDFPFAKSKPGVYAHATLLDNIFNLNFLRYPNWLWMLEIALVVGIAAAAPLVYPRLPTGVLVGSGVGLAVALLAVSFALFMLQGLWLHAFYPMLAAVLPLATTMSFKLRETEKVTRDVDAERVESQKQLGMSYQEKGLLDMALGTFNKLPVTEDMKLVYLNLGIDFENRQAREKAFLCYKRIFDADPHFQDVPARLEGLRRAGVGTRVFSEPTLAGRGTTMGAPQTMAAGAAMPHSDVESTRALPTQMPTQTPGGAPTVGSGGATRMPETSVGGAATVGPPGARNVDATMDVAPPPSTVVPTQGQGFGRYEILDKLGRGAMGDVYKVRDPKIGRVAALKTIRVDVDLSPAQMIELRQRFYREAQTAGKLTHPNIVTIYDVGEEQGISYIVMEFVEGNTLTSLVKKSKQLTVPQVKHVVVQSAVGLDYAHQNGVIHRDIKPDNIMIAKTGVVKLMDFGIARIVESDMTRTGSILGTPAYMSPEQFSGKKVDARSDVFSLGVVLYELLTNKRPFRGESATAIMFEILQKDPQPPSEAAPGVVNPAWDAVAQKALSKDMTQRFQTALELANAVRAVEGK